jgi:8-oxo-dGTP pyrophosphatase MutT (NUDIX family)
MIFLLLVYHNWLYTMREIRQTIVSAIILSKDRRILMGKKDPSLGGVWPDCWHIPGGGIDTGETLEQALVREVKEEIGLDISAYRIIPKSIIGTGITEKTLKETGEKVLCRMEFHRFEVKIDDKNAKDIQLHLGSDLVEIKWFTLQGLPYVRQIPGGKEFFEQMGYIPRT